MFLSKDEEKKDKYPIVFIPGTMGSELYSLKEGSSLSEEEESIGSFLEEEPTRGEKIFLPSQLDAEKLRKELSMDSSLYGLQQGNLNKLALFQLDAGPLNAYYPLLKALTFKFPNREIYLFSYDWRQSNYISKEKLYNFIKYISKGDDFKVDLIAHSMGGLVAAAFLEEYDHLVNRYASFGAPYEGAAMTYNTLASGKTVGDYRDYFIKSFMGIDESITKDYISTREMLPSKIYLEKYPLQIIEDMDKFEQINEDRTNYIYYAKFSSLEYEKALKISEENHVSRPASIEESDQAFIDIIGRESYQEILDKSQELREDNIRAAKLKLLERDKSIFFVSSGRTTDISSFIQKTDQGYKIVEGLASKEGDGMVPLYSATMGLGLDNLSPNYRDKFKLVKGSHMAMLSLPENILSLLEFLE